VTIRAVAVTAADHCRQSVITRRRLRGAWRQVSAIHAGFSLPRWHTGCAIGWCCDRGLRLWTVIEREEISYDGNPARTVGVVVMAITTTHCHVLGATVTRIMDLEGAVSRVICPEYQESTGCCRVLSNADRGGPLSRLLERVAGGGLGRRSPRCHLR